MALEITDGHLYYVAGSEIEKEGIATAHIKSADAFYARGKNQIVEEVFNIRATVQNERDGTEEDRSIKQISFEVVMSNTTAKKPVYENYDDGTKQILMPNKALIDGYNYSAEVHTTFTVKAKAYLKNGEEISRTETEKDFHIASFPVIIGSELCHTRHMSEYDKKMLGEDWKEKGGYVIIKGNDGKGLEWVIDMMESRPFNMPNIFHNIGHEKEISRMEFISKAGDGVENSFQIIVRHLLNGMIYATFNAPAYMNDIDIPFYLIFYLFGMTNQKEIVENIIRKDALDEEFDYVSNYISEILEECFTTKDPLFGDASHIFEFSALTKLFAEVIYNKNKSSNPGAPDNYSLYTLVNTTIVNVFDKCLFSHIGESPDVRHKKLRFFAHLIRKMLLVEMDIIPSTNRDSLAYKRIDACGRAYAKMLKTQFNLAVAMPIKAQLIKDFKSMPFSQVPLKQSVKSAVANNDLERNLIQAITTGNKELNMYNRKITNRLASETLYRKNQLNTLATIRTIRTHASSASSAHSSRSNEMRRVDGSYIGFYDIVYSAPTGDRVGLVKQQAMLTSVTESSSSELMKQILREDPDIIPFDEVFPTQIYYDGLTAVMVNYYPIGFCRDAHVLVAKYRELRRERKINVGISIYWDISSGEILFWCDAGRMLRPLLVVRNNTNADPKGQALFKSKYDPYNDEGFIQDVLITKQDILDIKEKKKTIVDLHAEGKIDYLSPDESENCLISKNLKNLRMHRNNALKRYTHCEIQIGVLGILGLTCPYASHNQITRVIYQTNQVRQACGIYALNYDHRMDKHTFVQYYVQEPVVQTIVNKHIYPNGMNAIVGIQAYTGFNQEDSIIYNETSASRLMYSVVASHIFSSKVENDEVVGAPDTSLTININKEANYSKLCTQKGVNYGIVRIGTIIKKNDVLIGKYATIPKTRDGQIYKDTSIIFNHDETCIVENVVASRNQDNDYYIRIKIVGHRLLDIGCKFSSRAGQKGEVGMGFADVNMPFTKSGITPDLIINPCAIPSRMTIGQLLEGLMGLACGTLGRFTDATIFNEEISDVTKIGDILEQCGFNRFGLEKMYSGFNGRWIDTEIFMVPTYYQLLQKFTIDDMYAVATGPTCILTHQPLEGASHQGGLRLGEMETWVLVSHGSSNFLMEKIRDDSDGYDLYVCRNCGKMPVVNEDKSIYRCQNCLDKGVEPDIFKVRSTWATKLFLQELESAGVGVSLGLKQPNNYIF